jgi:hypothetical protein
MRIRSWLVIGATALGFCAGCNDVQLDRNTPPEEDTTGSVAGRICAPTGDAWLENAYVYTNLISASGELTGIRETWTDRDGNFVLDRVPEAAQTTLYVQKGTFQASLEAEVRKGALTRLPDPPCLDPLSISAAVVTGEYDAFSDMLDLVGVTNYAEIDGADADSLTGFFSSLDALLGYDLICVNGGIVEAGVIDQPAIADNIAVYVQAGGSLFVTDWSYDVIERSFPDAVEFLGDDGQLNAAQLGVAGTVSDARVVDQSLAGYLGRQTVEIRYDLAWWPVIEGAAGQVVVHVTGNVDYYDGTAEVPLTGAPLLVSFSSGYGSVVFSTFRQGANLDEDMAQILQYMLYKL